MRNSWSNVAGELAIELYGNDGEAVDTVFNARDDKHIPAITPDMVPNLQDKSYDLVIEFESSGYYDSGKTCGLPENCYPPESDEERTPTRAYLIRYTAGHAGSLQKEEIELSSEKMDELFEHFLEEINSVELEEEMM